MDDVLTTVRSTTSFINTTICENCWLNGSNSTSKKGNILDFYKEEQLTFLGILFTFIIVGNGLVIIIILARKNRKSRMNFFILNLAIADLACGIFNVLVDIIWRTTEHFYAGNPGCKIVKFLQFAVTFSSTYVLVALSIDRYDAICRPMNFSGSRTRARILILAAWTMSLSFSIPSLVLFKLKHMPKSNTTQCWMDLPSEAAWQIYVTLTALAIFIIPTLIIIACYVIIIAKIWRKSQFLTTQTKQPGIALRSFRTNYPDIDREKEDLSLAAKRASSRGLIPKAKIKTIKMTFVIVFVFIMCWSPFFVFDLLQVYGHIPQTAAYKKAGTFIQSLTVLNSAANPIIYSLFTSDILKTLRSLPVCVWAAKTVCKSCCPDPEVTQRLNTATTDYTRVTTEGVSRVTREARSPSLGPPTSVLYVNHDYNNTTHGGKYVDFSRCAKDQKLV